jgi:hypothetical protein
VKFCKSESRYIFCFLRVFESVISKNPNNARFLRFSGFWHFFENLQYYSCAAFKNTNVHNYKASYVCENVKLTMGKMSSFLSFKVKNISLLLALRGCVIDNLFTAHKFRITNHYYVYLLRSLGTPLQNFSL